MPQPVKKSSNQPAAKLASSIANKATKEAFSAVESTRNSAESVVKIGSAAVKEFIATGATEAQKAQEKAFAIGREGAEKLSKSADVISKSLYEAVGVSRDNVEALVECGNLTAALAKDISSEIFEYANKSFSDNIEISKDVFACRTINDMVELQSKIVKSAFDSFFSESSKITGMLFEYSSEALEPINERFAEATDKLSKTISSVA